MEKWRGSLVADLGEEDVFFLKRGGVATLWLVEGKSGEGEERESIGWRGALCPAGWCGRGLPCAAALFFFK
jgi:hypothetical protein